MKEQRETPCDYGDCPFNAHGGLDCFNYCGVGSDNPDNEVPSDCYEESGEEENYEN